MEDQGLVQRWFIERVLVVLVIFLGADFFMGVLFGFFFSIGYFSEKSILRIVSDLGFIEGAVVFFVGALLAFFRSQVSVRAKVSMIVGALMIGASIGFGVFA